MKSLPLMSRLNCAARSIRTVFDGSALALMATCASLVAIPAHAVTPLADQPLFATANVPGNLALALSVEFPTAVSVAYTSRTYSSAKTYLGYFDPLKCYSYTYTDGTSVNNYFSPVATTTTRKCSNQWSGNFLNWATMQTIDPFRWVLTGGYRVIDTAALTVVEKAWASGQGGTNNFPDSTVTASEISGATPFSSAASMTVRIQGMQNKMRFTFAASSVVFTGQYYNNQSMTGTPVLTRTDNTINFNWDSSQPDPAVNQSNMSVKWTGNITITTAGTYTFRSRADDTVRLVVNNVEAFNQTQYVSLANQVSPSYTFTAGQVVPIEVDFSQGNGGSSVVLEWLTPTTTAYSVVGLGSIGDVNGATAVAYDGSATAGNVTYEAFVRAKVCDAGLGVAALEANCKAYGTPTANYKPEGLIQQYSNKMRYSTFGYLNDSNLLRDGGVLRAQQKFVGPTQPVPGSTPITNAPNVITGQTTGAEWDATTGVFVLHPDAADEAATVGNMSLPGAPTGMSSGVMNYLNKFGEASGTYKTYDNVSELYYAAIRYFKNLSDVPEWTAVGTASTTTITGWVDGFPVIKSPPDPILYSCQRNFILGIGDVHTWADRNVPGNTVIDTSEPPMPAAVTSDTSVDAMNRTNQVGVLEGLGSSLGSADGNLYGNCCGGNSALIAGLAYDAHVKDIRGRTIVAPAKPQTVDTYWVDVLEGQSYVQNNQFYLATKYGGFTVPSNYDINTTTPLTLTSWHNNTDGNGGTSTDASGNQPRPDHYYSGGQPDKMQAGLTQAFADIASSITAFTTSFSTSLPQLSQTSNASFSSQYDSTTWTGEVTASVLTFDPTTNAPTIQVPPSWTLSTNLANQFSGTGWKTNRRIVTWSGTAGVAFEASGPSQVASADLATLDTSYVTGDDKTNYLNYLRGDQSNEVGVSGGTQAYRKRTKLLGDIVGAQVAVAGPPSYPYSDATNAGYSSFKSTYATRRTMVYMGSNDGMLHAINGALLTSPPPAPVPPAVAPVPALEVDANAGTEVFAYVPEALFKGPHNTPNVDGLASLGNPSFSHHNMVNATPGVYDIDLNHTFGSTITTPKWRSVLIGGLGTGGKSYYAIDVTQPLDTSTPSNPQPFSEATVAGKVLWEVSDPVIGFTFGLPLVVKTVKYGWVVVLTSGYNNVDGQGYFVFVNPATGAILERVTTGTGSVANDAGLAHANAFVVDSSNGTADAIYAGDIQGNLWRLDVTGTAAYPAPVRMASLTDSGGNAQPVTTDPWIDVDPATKKRTVMVGTGRLLATTDIASTAVQSFYAFQDGTNAAFVATPVLPLAFPYTRAVLANNTNALVGAIVPSTDVGWYEDLGVDVSTPAQPGPPPVPAHASTGIAWRVISDPSTLSGSVAFSAVLPSGDPCNPSGKSRGYGRQFSNGLTTIRDSISTAPVSYVPFDGTITNLKYLSVNGKPALVVGTDSGAVGQISINPPTNDQLRRLNWRELDTTE